MRYDEIDIVDSNGSYYSPVNIKYVYKNRHKWLKNTIFGITFLCMLVFNVLFIMDAINTPFTNRVLYTVQNILKKPTDELFGDDSEVFFVNWLLNIPYDDGKVQFVSPVKHSNYHKVNNVLCIENAGKVVYSVERGTVTLLEYNDDGNKYMEITHPSGFVSTYNGLDFVGAVLGDVVACGQLVGSSVNTLEFCLLKNGERVSIDLSQEGLVLNE